MPIKDTLNDYIVGLKHVGHVVDDLDAAVAAFCDVYGVDASNVRRVPENPGEDAPALFAFVTVANVEFELIQPVSEQFCDQLLANPSGGAGINHVAWRVRDIEACLDLLGEQGIRPGHVTPDGIVTFDKLRLVYLDPRDTQGMLIELIEIAD